jgi:hypothetical protein
VGSIWERGGRKEGGGRRPRDPNVEDFETSVKMRKMRKMRNGQNKSKKRAKIL